MLTKDEISLKLVNAWYENTKMQSYSQAKNSLQCYVNAALELQHTLSKIECANAILEETHNSNLARTCLNVKDI